MWRVSSRSGVATLRTAIHLLLTYLLLWWQAAASLLDGQPRLAAAVIGVRVITVKLVV